MIRALRPHQESAVASLRASLLAGKRRPMLQAPTGAGKTLLAAAVIEMALAKSKKVIFTVPRISLIDQTVDMFMHEGIVEVGVIQASHELTDPSRPVQVASVQTLMKREIPASDLIIIDEAHMAFDFVHEWMAKPEWQRVPFIGLTATPWTKGLGKHYDDLIVAAKTKDLIEAGHLSPFRVYAPSHPDLSGVKTVAGDYHEGQLAKVMSAPKLVADVVETWLEKGGDQPTLCFAVDRAHAKHLAERFEASGVTCGYVDCNTSLEDRGELWAKFKRGDVRVICNVGVMTTGVDLDVRCLILARPTKSEILYTQIIGRALRTAPGKDHALILDHSDTTMRLGFVTDIHHEHLDDGRERQKAEPREELPKPCPQCAYLKPPRTPQCPSCGFTTRHGPKGIRCDDGELIELTPRKHVEATLGEKARWYAELLGYANRKGYKPGWAANKYREKFGVWPRGVRFDPPRAPSPEVLNWIKAKQIAFAKGRVA